MKVGDFIVERLHAWGVGRIYGYPGDGISGVIGALQRAGNMEFIQVGHEEWPPSWLSHTLSLQANWECACPLAVPERPT
jgi:hypothetical protein